MDRKSTPAIIAPLLALLLALPLIAGCGQSHELHVPAATVNSDKGEGISWWSRAAIDAYSRYTVWSGERSAVVTMFARDGQPIYANATGWADIGAEIPVQLNTPMRFASMTKPVTATAAMMLVERGDLALDEPVEKYIPAFAKPRVASSYTANVDGSFNTAPAETTLLVKHLLMFASGVGPGLSASSDLAEYWQAHGLKSAAAENLGQRVNRIARLPLFEEPGIRWRYGGSADVLARLVEVASGESFATFLANNIFIPLNMNSTRFLSEIEDRSSLAKVYMQNAEGDLVLSPTKSDANNWTPGGSGLVSTAEDYMRFALMLWNRGQYQGQRILSEQTIAEMTKLQLPGGVMASIGIEGIGWGLGMSVIADGDVSPMPGLTGDYGWSGYYGTNFVVSPSTGLVAVVLTQNEPTQYGGRPEQVHLIQALGMAGM